MPSSSVADLHSSFGAAFVGLLFSTTLFGLTIVQTWMYFWTYGSRDSKPLKFFVAFVTSMDALHTIICVYAIYWYLILNISNVESLEDGMWALNLQIILGIIVGASVQLFVLLCETSLRRQPKSYLPDSHRGVSRHWLQ
ncbi:hypothetical protein H4582DRAFT_2079218 [Lactarius indigo]|nr:hypothetical protein H4582DRAFT_2079218 [Lactarius indigo]